MATIKQTLIACISFVMLLTMAPSTIADDVAILNESKKVIFNALTEQKILNKGRQLVQLVHVCNLIIDDKTYPVINIHEYIKGPQIPRTAYHILVLDDSLALKRKIFYTGTVAPLYCKDNQLFLHGLIDIDGLVPDGNVITFSDEGKAAIASEIDANDFPVQDVPQ